eukprot:4680114-Pyramimonas_sp.AAC.1
MSDLRYIGGGVAMSNRRLDEDLPASPAPGTALFLPSSKGPAFQQDAEEGSLQLRRLHQHGAA